MKTFVVLLDTKTVRTVRGYITPRVGDVIEDTIWVGQLIKGGKIIKVYK